MRTLAVYEAHTLTLGPLLFSIEFLSSLKSSSPFNSDPAAMARRARLILMYSDGGEPIRDYLERNRPMSLWDYLEYYGLVKSTPRARSVPQEANSRRMKGEIAAWLEKEFSAPAIYLIEKYGGMKVE